MVFAILVRKRGAHDQSRGVRPAGARACGLNAILFTSNDQVIPELDRLLAG